MLPSCVVVACALTQLTQSLWTMCPVQGPSQGAVALFRIPRCPCGSLLSQLGLFASLDKLYLTPHSWAIGGKQPWGQTWRMDLAQSLVTSGSAILPQVWPAPYRPAWLQGATVTRAVWHCTLAAPCYFLKKIYFFNFFLLFIKPKYNSKRPHEKLNFLH